MHGVFGFTKTHLSGVLGMLSVKMISKWETWTTEQNAMCQRLSEIRM